MVHPRVRRLGLRKAAHAQRAREVFTDSVKEPERPIESAQQPRAG
jgi:hypothetical protein